MSDERALVPIEQKQVEFYGDELTAVRAEDGHIYAGINQMCGALGIDPQAQRRRMERHAVLAKGLGVAILATPGGRQHGYVLRADLVPLWLAGIRASMVNEDVRPKLVKFQEEAAVVLWEAFQDGRLTGDPAFDELLQQDTPEVEAYKMIQGMLRLAQNQIILRARLEDHEQRLEAIESQLTAPTHTVTQSQAMQVSQAVKAVAFAMGGRKENFQGVYGELYRHYEITSYKLLPANRFEDCMAWLTEWHMKLTGLDKLPF